MKKEIKFNIYQTLKEADGSISERKVGFIKAVKDGSDAELFIDDIKGKTFGSVLEAKEWAVSNKAHMISYFFSTEFEE